MRTWNWLTGLLGGRPKPRRGATTNRPRPRRRLALERLEDRTVPTAGALDVTFGLGGKVVTDIREAGPGYDSAQGQAVAVQADGKIVVAGSAAEVATGLD